MSYRDFTAYFNRLSKLGQGSYGQVFLCSPIESKCENIESSPEKQNIVWSSNLIESTTNQKTLSPSYFAIKKLKMRANKPSSYYQQEKPQKVEELREIQIIKSLHHENLMQFKQILIHDKQYKTNYYLLLPFGVEILEFAKQKEVMLTKSLRKTIIYQIVTGLKEIHSQNIMHRDIKPDNIFLMKNGLIKIGDFSLSRKKIEKSQSFSMVQESQEPCAKLSGNVTTRYYRAPQIMYGSRNYDQKIDIWSLGCTIAEIILHQPLFPGQTDINQLQLIFKTIGYPQQQWPKANELPYYLEFTKDQQEKGLNNVLPDIESDLLQVIEQCLMLDPERRVTCEKLLNFKYFADVEKKSLELEKLAVYLHQKKIKEVIGKKH